MDPSELAKSIDNIRYLLEHVKIDEAQRLMKNLIEKVASELPPQQEDVNALRETINLFLPKRRRRLLSLLPNQNIPNSNTQRTPQTSQLDASLQLFASTVRQDLDNLSQHQIFQWSTSYRDILSKTYVQALALVGDGAPDHLVHRIIVANLRQHAHEIFGAGYKYQTTQQRASQITAIQKGFAGLHEFLWIPLELMGEILPTATSPKHAFQAWQIASKMLVSILEGFITNNFNTEQFSELLQQNERYWIDCLPFLSLPDLETISGIFQESEWTEARFQTFAPLAHVWHQLIAESVNDWALPRHASFRKDLRRVEIRAFVRGRTSAPYILIHCYLNSAPISYLEESFAHGAQLILAPLSAEARTLVSSDSPLYRSLVDTLSSSIELEKLVTSQISKYIGVLTGHIQNPILSFNYAREFPLDDPFTPRFLVVARPSVRSLLKTLERETGVHLWCSVRRSGKTTASFNLSSDAPNAVVIKQTMEHTSQHIGANRFAERIVNAIESGRQVSHNFFAEAVIESSDSSIARGTRIVFVLDEYETLFERLRIAAEEHESLIYKVARPLLNQMVSFSRDHLIILVGQRPNAQHILMDQNQLSPYVKQASFPLFAHVSGGEQSELDELVQKALLGQVRCSREFIDLVYDEAGGHPFLTVQLLVDLLDWLIGERQPVPNMELSAPLFLRFAKYCLHPNIIVSRSKYQMFDAIVTDALRGRTAWLRNCYEILRRLGRSNTLTMTRFEFVDLCRKELRMKSPLHFLSEASLANFLSYDELNVRPRIRLLARIAAGASEEVLVND